MASLDCSKTKIQPDVGLGRADRFIHHIQCEYQLGDENGSRASSNAGDGHEKCEAFLKRRQALCHFLLQLPNTLLEKIEMGKGLSEQKAMMGFSVPL